jgi:hypothetical protein
MRRGELPGGVRKIPKDRSDSGWVRSRLVIEAQIRVRWSARWERFADQSCSSAQSPSRTPQALFSDELLPARLAALLIRRSRRDLRATNPTERTTKTGHIPAPNPLYLLINLESMVDNAVVT